MYKLYYIAGLWAYSFLAQAALPFKKEVAASTQSLPYVVVVLVLLALLLLLGKYTKKNPLSKAQSYLVETIALPHKTKAYILEYQGQRILIAENQQAIAIHPLNKEGAPS